jgi:hypothetical protein
MKLTRILELQNDVEARLLDAVLSEREIPHVIRSLHDTAYDGLMQAQAGCWGWVEAPEEERETIAALYHDIIIRRGEADVRDGLVGEETAEEDTQEDEVMPPPRKKGQADIMFWGLIFLAAGLVMLGIIVLVSR